jgi:hypothetical protein
MPEIIRNCEQGSDEWFSLRLGSIGGSSIAAAVAGGAGKMRNGLMYRLASEILTGVKAETFKFQHADRGHQFEDDARAYANSLREIEPEQVAIVKSDKPYRHYSPDSLHDGMDEIKVRIPSVFVEACEAGYYPTDVKKQIQYGLLTCEKDWCDYIQYCPEFANAQLNPILIERIYRDEKTIKTLDKGADQFIEEMLDMVERMKSA